MFVYMSFMCVGELEKTCVLTCRSNVTGFILVFMCCYAS